MQKVEAIMILIAFAVVFVAIGVHLVIAAVESRKLKNFNSLGDLTFNIENDLDDNQSTEKFTIRGTLESSRDYRNGTSGKGSSSK